MTNETVYKLQSTHQNFKYRKVFSVGGKFPKFTNFGRVFTRGLLMRHFGLFKESEKDNKAVYKIPQCYKDSQVVEYELVEKSRMSVDEFIKKTKELIVEVK